jgi:hypothetical protein
LRHGIIAIGEFRQNRMVWFRQLQLPPFFGPSGTMMNGGFIYDSKSQHNLDKSQ